VNGEPVRDGAGEPAGAPRPGAPGPGGSAGTGPDVVEEWGVESFPASDPPQSWR
jgi:hypothetical protein